MAKPAIVTDVPGAVVYGGVNGKGEFVPSERARVISPDEDDAALKGPHAETPDNDELQSELDAQRALNEAPQPPTQPYTRESDVYRNELIAKKAKLDCDIGVLEGQRDGMNARIDDMHATRVAVEAGLASLK